MNKKYLFTDRKDLLISFIWRIVLVIALIIAYFCQTYRANPFLTFGLLLFYLLISYWNLFCSPVPEKVRKYKVGGTRNI